MIIKCLLLFLSLDFVIMFKTFYSYHSISYKLVTNKFKRQLHSNIIDQSIEEDVHKHFMQLALRHAQVFSLVIFSYTIVCMTMFLI